MGLTTKEILLSSQKLLKVEEDLGAQDIKGQVLNQEGKF
tara:strand:+ start:457 stop:573 length:117 start_codon:yes stop_codon:yes gene_type:complete